MSKFRVGDLVQTIIGSQIKAKGPIHEIKKPNKDLQLLWGGKELHYLVKDMETGEFISVRESGIEKT